MNIRWGYLKICCKFIQIIFIFIISKLSEARSILMGDEPIVKTNLGIIRGQKLVSLTTKMPLRECTRVLQRKPEVSQRKSCGLEFSGVLQRKLFEVIWFWSYQFYRSFKMNPFMLISVSHMRRHPSEKGGFGNPKWLNHGAVNLWHRIYRELASSQKMEHFPIFLGQKCGIHLM